MSIAADPVAIHWVKLPDPPDRSALERLTRTLPKAMTEEVRRFVFEADQARCLYGKLLVHKGIAPEAPVLELLSDWRVGEYGRPMLPGKADFNLSHSGQVVAMASGKGPLGFDVEQIKTLDLSLFGHYMNDREWADIHAAAHPEQRFFHYWTIKEAVMKAEGMGFHLPVEEILVEDGKAWVRGRQWHIQRVDLEPAYMAHLATAEPVAAPLLFGYQASELGLSDPA